MMIRRTVAVVLLSLVPALGAPHLAAAQQIAALPPAAVVSPAAPGEVARVWFLHQFRPDEGTRSPIVYANGMPIAASAPGTAFYRDFAPGTYTFSVETCTEDVNQAATITLAPGSQTDIEIQSLSSFHSWGCPSDRTYYARIIPPAWAELYRPQLAYVGAR